MGMTTDLDGASRKMTPEEVAHDGRKRIDAVIQFVKIIKADKEWVDPAVNGREWALAYTHLQEAKMWLGKALEELGSELPAQYQDKAEGENHAGQ